MKRSLILLSTLATLHVSIAAMHAAHLQEWNIKPAWLLRIITVYGDYTGAGNIFSFFAPHIGDETTVIYTIADAKGQQIVRQLEGANTESNRRIQTTYNFFNIPEAQQLLAQSCAAYMLQLYPQGKWIRVTVVSREIPTMTAFRNGARPQWSPMFIKDFTKRPTTADTQRPAS